MTKRIISLLLVLVMVVSMLPAQAVAAGYRTALDKVSDLGEALDSILEQRAEESTAPTVSETVPETTQPPAIPEALPEPEPEIILTDTEGDYTYTVSSDNTATITGYSGTETELVIPDTLGGYPVTGIADSVFANRNELINVILPDTVTSLGRRVFAECTKLVSVNLPDGLKKMAYNVFRDCDSLEQVVIPAGITDSGDGYWFENCDTLKKIILGDGMEMIPKRAFANLQTDFTVEFPETLVTIGEGAFYGCSGVAQMTLPPQLVKIDGSAFRECTSLERIDIPNTVSEICGWAFCNCDALRTITIPAGIASSGDGNWFINCDNLTQITIADGAALIPDHAFNKLETDFEIVIPASVQSIEPYAFGYCSGVRHIELPEALSRIGSQAFYGCTSLESIVIPDTVTEIKGQAFYNCDGLTEVVIPASVTDSGAGFWFEECDNLVKIEIGQGAASVLPKSIAGLLTAFELHLPDSIVEIGSGSFSGCAGLTEINLPNSVATIGKNAFASCSQINEINLPESLKYIGAYAFSGWTGLTKIDFPDSVTDIDGRAFYNCINLTEVKLPQNWENVNPYSYNNISGAPYYDGPFAGCVAITEIDWPDGSLCVPDYAFYNCSALEDVTLSQTITEIGAYAFGECSQLAAVEIPDSVTGIDSRAFYNCSKLMDVALPYGWTDVNPYAYNRISGDPYYDGPFSGCVALKEITVPEGISKLPIYAFYNCTSLEIVSLPESLTDIRSYAFGNCSSLSKICIPNAVTNMSGRAFYDCTGLMEVELPSGWTSVEPYAHNRYSGLGIYDGPFAGCTALTSIVIPVEMEVLPMYALYNATALTDVYLPESLTDIRSYALGGCTSLDAIDIPDSVTNLSGRAFYNCTALKNVSLPSAWARVAAYGHNVYSGAAVYDSPFSGCTSLTGIDVTEGIQVLPAYAFYGVAALLTVRLPKTVTTIEKSAMQGCASMQSVVVFDTVNAIGKNAFADCPNLIISCSASSYVLEYALRNDLMVEITDWSRLDSDVLNMDNTYYNTNTGDTNASGYVDLVVHYELKPEQAENLSDMKLKILLQSKLVLVEKSLRLDGEVPSGYTYKDNVLTVSVTEASGTLRFSVNPESAARLFSRAEFVYTKDGVSDSDIIDCINSHMPVLTLITAGTVNTADIRVSGIAPAEAALTFYIDDAQAGTAAASKAGNYSAELAIPEPQEGKTYTVKAVAAAGETTVEKSMPVTYDLASPVLEELLLYYSGHETGRYENYIVDLTDPHAGRTVITFNPTHDYIFRVKMSCPEQISCLYVTSTRNGQTKYIEAKYDEKTGYFVTKDKFDNDVWNYVPGEIGVIFDLNYENINMGDPEAVSSALIQETAEEADLSDIESNVIANTAENVAIETVLPDGTEIGYEYHEFTPQELYAYLLELGLVSPGDQASVQASLETRSFVELLQDLLEEYLSAYAEEAATYYLGQTRDGSLISICVDKTFSEEGDQIFKTWVIDSSAEDLVAYALDPDAYIFGISDELSGMSGAVYSSGKATVNYLGRMWQLDMQYMYATEAEQKHIQQTRELLTFVFVSRLVFAAASVSLSIAFPGASLAIKIGYDLLSNMLDSLEEEEDWVTGFDNSIIGSLFLKMDYGFQWLIDNLLKWIIDPSGYVYEAVTTNRLPGVTTTVYYQDPQTGAAVFWDATEYDQMNPIITGPDGSYAWDVPEGLWQVKYELEGYETVYSEWMPVPPPQTDVNIGLVSYEVPEAQWIDVFHDAVEIEFSKYMNPDTVDNITLTDSRGNAIAYTLEYSTDETAADGTVYAREFALEFDSAFLNRGESCIITIPGVVQSYAGVGAEAETLTRVCTEEIVISAPAFVAIPYGEQTVISVSVSAEDVETIEVVSMFAERAAVEAVEKTDPGWDITITGQLPGRTAVLISIPGTGVSKYVELVIDASDGAHTHDYNCEMTAEAACTVDGSCIYTCTICGESYIETIPAFGHSFGDWIVLEEPTTAGEGREVRTCTVCGHTEERTTARLDNPFSDVAAGSFYFDPVMWAVENGITNGTSATTFGPNDQCMRAHVVTFLWRAMGSPEPRLMVNPFVDVKPTDFYYKPVLWALENGITSGMDATHFGPTSYCNRAQVVTFLYRTMGSPELDGMDNPFDDVQAGAFYEKPVLWAVRNGITNGLSATEFGPNAICNRAQIVTFLYRAFVDA